MVQGNPFVRFASPLLRGSRPRRPVRSLESTPTPFRDPDSSVVLVRPSKLPELVKCIQTSDLRGYWVKVTLLTPKLPLNRLQWVDYSLPPLHYRLDWSLGFGDRTVCAPPRPWSTLFRLSTPSQSLDVEIPVQTGPRFSPRVLRSHLPHGPYSRPVPVTQVLVALLLLDPPSDSNPLVSNLDPTDVPSPDVQS